MDSLHRLSTESENGRICLHEGVVRNERINGIIAVTRSFGDIQHKANYDRTCIISPIPYVVRRKIELDNEYLILGTDELFDCCSPEEAANILVSKVKETDGDSIHACDLLVNEAIRRGSCDNVSAIIIFFHQKI